jgi:hypothetical protein
MQSPKKITATLLLLAASMLLSSCERSDVSSTGRLVLFSPLSGQLLYKGKPVSGVLVQQTVTWGANGKFNLTTTDGSGRFSFPIFTESSLPQQTAPQEAKVEQYVVALVGRTEVILWEHIKRNYDPNGELFFIDADGRSGHIRDRETPISLTCKLENKRRVVGSIDSPCDLDGAPNANLKGA